VTDEAILHGPLYDELVRAMQRVPEIAGRDLSLTALTGGITNRNFRVDAAGTDQRWVIRLAGNDTHLLGISREVEHAATVAAAGVGVGPEVTAFIRPEGYLVTRFIVGSPVSDEAVHRPETLRRVADSLRRIHDGPDAGSKLRFWPTRSSCGHATTTCSTPTSSTTERGSGSSTGNTRGWATRSSILATSASTTS
jgi:aminoglycoside phosphotransferase (APT) family kinase protein